MKLSECSCILCGRSKLKSQTNHPPPMQRAHVVANRFSAREKRDNGVRNPFTDDEWHALLSRFGSEFGLADGLSRNQWKRRASQLFSPMCAECHEEVLS